MSSRRKTKKSAERVSPARAAAFRALRGVEQRRGDPAKWLHGSALGDLSSTDKNLATEIVYGVLRWRARLDYMITAHAGRAASGIDPAALQSLRIGLYQLRFLDRVPPHAAVDESVRLVRAFGAARAAGFVNAVLRSALRRPELPPLPDRGDRLAYLSITLSHPRWLVERYLSRDGFETAERRCAVQNESPPVYLRVSPKLDVPAALETLMADGIRCEVFPLTPGCLKVLSGFSKLSGLQERGLVFIQDAGSQLVSWLVAPRRGERVLDVCAGPGAKATRLAELAGSGAVIALDLRPTRARLLARLSRRLGVQNVFPVIADGRRPPVLSAFDRILVDVPCSSLGTVRRNPDVKWRVTEEDLSRHAELQFSLLRAAGERLAVGGRLVYATCSSEPEENEAVVERFLSENDGFRLVPCGPSLPQAAGHLATPGGALQTFPERDDVDGYFGAILTRTR